MQLKKKKFKLKKKISNFSRQYKPFTFTISNYIERDKNVIKVPTREVRVAQQHLTIFFTHIHKITVVHAVGCIDISGIIRTLFLKHAFPLH